jgi:DEAD/DEAH box helicase domain-containing protein
MIADGRLLTDRKETTIYSARRMPHRDVHLRGVGVRYRIVDATSGRCIGEIDHFRALKETHPGAVYLHKGRQYLVKHLSMETLTVSVNPVPVDYYTRVTTVEEIEIEDVKDEKPVGLTRMFRGRLTVTEQVTGYERRRIHGGTRLAVVDLDLPPLVFKTQGMWMSIPPQAVLAKTDGPFHFLGGLHALEHAAIGILPLLVLADRNDIGGVSTALHPQIGTAAVFIYDGIPGGAGLSHQAYHKGSALLTKTLETIRACPCESGCPACVQSPKCGSGNRPLDKAGAQIILQGLLDPRLTQTDPVVVDPISAPARRSSPMAGRRKMRQRARKAGRVGHGRSGKDMLHYGVFDVETQRSAREVGGWDRADLMRISCVVVYDSQTDAFASYLEDQVPDLIRRLERFDLLVGFNIKRFDYNVLCGYDGFDAGKLVTLDILEDVHRYLGFRLSLNHLAKATLGVEKSADGLQALEWWKAGRIRKIVRYCRKDVEITRDLFNFGRKTGHLLFNDKSGKTLRIPVDWQEKCAKVKSDL